MSFLLQESNESSNAERGLAGRDLGRSSVLSERDLVGSRGLNAEDLGALASRASPARGVIEGAPAGAAGWVMKKLRPRHLQIASLHVSGLDRASIAEFVGCTPQLITMLFKQKLFLDHVAELHAQMDHELRALRGKAVRVMDRAMDETQDIDAQLKGADMVMKATGGYKDAGGVGAASAEDVVAALLARAPSVAIQVNVGGQPPVPNRDGHLYRED